MKVLSAKALVDYTDVGLTYDDVNLVPRRGIGNSRSNINVECRLVDDIVLYNPLIPANMDTITGSRMAACANNSGSIGFIHRFGDRCKMMREAYCDMNTPFDMGVSIGLNDTVATISDIIKEFSSINARTISGGKLVFLLDLAHAHSARAIKFIRWFKALSYGVPLIVGNVTEPFAVQELLDAGADGIKCGIGNGSVCSTRLKTGCGVPQFSVISRCSDAILKWTRRNNIALYNRPTLIADGGIKYPGDIVKALAAGADCCMSGYLFAGTQDTPGDTIKKGVFPNEQLYKVYRGSASRSSKADRGESFNVEGVSIEILAKGSTEDIFSEVLAGVQSGMSYCGVETVNDLQREALFVRVSPSSIIEAQPNSLRSL